MLTLQQIKQDPQDIIRRLAVKGFDGTEPINRILELDAERRRLQLENDNAAAQLKKHAEAIGRPHEIRRPRCRRSQESRSGHP